jgi:hypothetical protein
MAAILGRLLRAMRKMPLPRTLTSAIALVMLLGGTALAVTTVPGLLNGGFEDGLNDWQASVVHNGVYQPTTSDCSGNPEKICVVNGDDSFSVTDGVYSGPQTVHPLEGTKMLRLGGPFLNSGTHQSLDQYVVTQDFVVDPANPILQLNYNVYTWDYTGFDDLVFKVKLTDQNGDVIARQDQSSFGPSGDIHLKSTGWRPTHIDLSGYEGQQVHLQISSGGTSDNLYGFWAYIDAGLAPAPPVGDPQTQTINDPSGGTVPTNVFNDPETGESWIIVPQSSVNHFGSGGGLAHCMPMTLNVPINGGSGTVSNVHLLLDPRAGGAMKSFAMTDDDHNGVWTGNIGCAETGDLYVTYSVTEGTTTQQFSVPLGGLVLIDPSGTVYDKRSFDQAVAAGQPADLAKINSAVSGAVVRLQRCTSTSGGCSNVLSGDPGISPNVNPETTGHDGHYEWNANSGKYRVVVTKGGYDTFTSAIRTIPPPVTDLDVALNPTGYTGPPSNNNQGGSQQQQQQQVTQSGGTQNTTGNNPPPKKKACAGLKGKKLKSCKAKQKLKAALAKCGKLKGKKKAACKTKVRALAKCDKLKGKKRAACRNKVHHPGRKKH